MPLSEHDQIVSLKDAEKYFGPQPWDYGGDTQPKQNPYGIKASNIIFQLTKRLNYQSDDKEESSYVGYDKSKDKRDYAKMLLDAVRDYPQVADDVIASLKNSNKSTQEFLTTHIYTPKELKEGTKEDTEAMIESYENRIKLLESAKMLIKQEEKDKAKAPKPDCKAALDVPSGFFVSASDTPPPP